MKKFLKKMIVKFNLINIMSISFYFFRIFKVKNNRIVCLNFSGKGYGDSPKYIIEELLKKDENYEIIWAVKNLKDNNFPLKVKKVKFLSLKYIYYLSTAKIWINNSRFDLFVRKRPNQFYIQTWHSPLRLKKIEMDAIDGLSEYYKKVMVNDSKNIDIMISGCDFSYNIYSNSFLYDGPILEIGTPRCDLFFDKQKKDKIKKEVLKKYKIKKEKKIILYAPTFRKYTNFTDCLIDINKLLKDLKDDYIILIKLHPSTKLHIGSSNNIINVSDWADIQELICITDFMITDYSSCCFDAMIANKPCILFIKDLNNYMSYERSLYFDIRELPFEKAVNEKELADKINNFDFINYNDKIVDFENKIGLYEKGVASKQLVKLIKKEMKQNEKI